MGIGVQGAIMRDFVLQSNRLKPAVLTITTGSYLPKAVFKLMFNQRPQTDDETLAIDGLPLPCHLVRSRRKSLAVHVRHDRIEVRAPLSVARGDILHFLGRHQAWVCRTHKEKVLRAAEYLSLAHGSEILYKARTLTIRLRVAPRSSVEISDTHLCISGPELSPEKVAAILKGWLLAQAKAWLPTRTHALAEHLGLGHKFKEVVFRKTRRKWGHCTAQGRIQYNWLIMLAPDGVIDYMICHEVCHLLHMNHSPAYWQSVARVCPDYKRYVGWLKRHEHRLWF